MLADLMTAVNVLISAGKKVTDLSKKVRDADLRMAIADMQVAAAELKVKVADGLEENIELRHRLDEAEKAADIRPKLTITGSLYYLSQPMEGYGEGPFCPTCMDGKGRLMMLTRKFVKVYGPRTGNMLGPSRRMQSAWRCHECGGEYAIE